jgi:hypothetical protein
MSDTSAAREPALDLSHASVVLEVGESLVARRDRLWIRSECPSKSSTPQSVTR